MIAASLIPVDASFAAEEPAQNAAQAPNAWQWVSIYKADLLATNAPRQTSGVGNLNLRVDVDGAVLFGWDDTALRAELLWNHGGKPNRRLATTQGISNLEVAQNAARVYATWIEHQFRASGTRVLFGLYDLNSEFYATDASGLLIHPKPAEPEPNKQYDARHTDGEVNDHGCCGTDGSICGEPARCLVVL